MATCCCVLSSFLYVYFVILLRFSGCPNLVYWQLVCLQLIVAIDDFGFENKFLRLMKR